MKQFKNESSTKLGWEEYSMLKDRLYRSKNALELALRSCPDLGGKYIKLEDGHQLTPDEIIRWLEAVRDYIWRYGPSDVQSRYMKKLIKQQPAG